MRDLLLDTNIWDYWFDPTCEEHDRVRSRAQELPAETKLVLSIITWGEIEYGYRAMTKKERSCEERFHEFIKAKEPWTVPLDKHVTRIYGKLRACLFEKYAAKDKKRKGLRPEQLIDPATSLELGIQENDLWIAAQALALNLTLVTNDEMQHLRDVAGESLHVDNWAAEGK